MARYPEFADYEQSGKFKEGIKRCDDLLKKHPKDVQLLSTKMQLLAADGQDGTPILEQLLAIDPPIRDLGELFNLNVTLEQMQRNDWPRPRTAGAEMAKLWDNAVKATTSVQDKHELLMQRFETAVASNYMIDAQQALIQLKTLQPKNRMLYMAHAAVTQLTSISKDDMQSRLGLMLAKKAVKEKFDEEKDLDCRVPAQIFALQDSRQDLEAIAGTRFAESKQVYEASGNMKREDVNGLAAVSETIDASKAAPSEWLSAEIADLKARFAQLVETAAGLDALLSFAANAIRLFHTSLQTIPTARSRTKGEVCFVAISALVRAYELSQHPRHLLISAHLAETLLSLDKHIHEARMILVYLYMRLGLGGLAIKYFESLNIKEMQLDTVGHALFTDLTYIYPHDLAFTKDGDPSPKSKVPSALQVHQRYEMRLHEAEGDVLRSGQTGMIFDLHELRDKLRSSVTRRIGSLELRRHLRILRGETDSSIYKLEPRRLANWLETTDNRDFAATFDYGYNVEKALHGPRGEPPGREWISYGLAADVAWCLAKSKGEHAPISDPEALLEQLEKGAADIGRLSLDDSSDRQLSISDSDYLAGDLACQCLKLLLSLRDKSAEEGDLTVATGKTSIAVDRLNVTALCETNDTCSERLKDHYLYLDILRIAASVCDFALKVPKTSSCTEQLHQLQQRANDEIAALKAHAEQQRERVSAKHVQAAMAGSNDEVFTAVKAFGENELQEFCEAVAGAAKVGWSGVGKVKW